MRPEVLLLRTLDEVEADNADIPTIQRSKRVSDHIPRWELRPTTLMFCISSRSSRVIFQLSFALSGDIRPRAINTASCHIAEPVAYFRLSYYITLFRLYYSSSRGGRERSSTVQGIQLFVSAINCFCNMFCEMSAYSYVLPFQQHFTAVRGN